MAKQSSTVPRVSSPHPSLKARGSSRLAAKESRVDRMVELIDHCAAAQAIADDLGETFLAYLLAMAIQEARSKMRGASLISAPHS